MMKRIIITCPNHLAEIIAEGIAEDIDVKVEDVPTPEPYKLLGELKLEKFDRMDFDSCFNKESLCIRRYGLVVALGSVNTDQDLRRLHFEHDIGMNRAIDWIRRYVASLGNPSVVNEYKKAQQILAALDAGPEEKGVSCGHMG